MSNKKLILGVAAGVAALAVVGVLIAKKKSKKTKLSGKAEEAKDNFRSKLQELKKKATKEFNSTLEDGENLVNKAKDRANEWVSKASN
ncbi:hypothetical protein [uncultured Flavobacterium sp.]|uniref:hypothetical protein n=1 Tax=uncultured Flavobacterium sp. TaxID=165435 RepID=UPI0025CBA195|nr:hypothetical protein [uncultured Flavobacterium sp.]